MLLSLVMGALMLIDAADAQGITRIVIVDEKNYFGTAKLYFYQHDPGNITGTNRYIMAHNFGDNITLANGIRYKVALKEDMGTAAVDRILGFDQATVINIVLSAVVILLIVALIYYMKKK
jgi:outer membrane receptor for monomeric catechols